MKLNIFAKKDEPIPPSTMTPFEIQEVHDFLALIVTDQTPIRFPKLKKHEVNPLRLATEVLAYVLKLDHGNQVRDMIAHLRKQLKDFADKQAEQQKAINIIEAGSTPPMIVGRNGK